MRNSLDTNLGIIYKSGSHDKIYVQGKYLTTYLKSLFGIRLNMSSFANPNIPLLRHLLFPTSVNEVSDITIHPDVSWWEPGNCLLFLPFPYSLSLIHKQIQFILSLLLTSWSRPL